MAIVISLLLSAAFGTAAFADRDYSEYTDTVEIKAGDTLYSICTSRGLNYGEVENALVAANSYSSSAALSSIKPGQKIAVPKSKAAADKIVELAGTAAKAEISSDDIITYTVRLGDTVAKICSEKNLTYSVCKQTIKDLNGWTGNARLSLIFPGQTIKLPASDSKAANIATTISKAEKANESLFNPASSGDTLRFYIVSYEVSGGETLKLICDSLGVEYSKELEAQIMKLNNLTDAGKIKAGQSYYVLSSTPANAEYAVYSHKIVSGDTVSDLCGKYEVRYSKVSSVLAALNPDRDLSAIRTGQSIYLVSPVGNSMTQIVIK